MLPNKERFDRFVVTLLEGSVSLMVRAFLAVDLGKAEAVEDLTNLSVAHSEV